MKSACPVPIGCLVFWVFSSLDIQSYLLRFKVLFLVYTLGESKMPTFPARHLGCCLGENWKAPQFFRNQWDVLFVFKNIWDQFQIFHQEMNFKIYTDHLFHFSSPSTGQSLGTIAGLQLAVESHTCVDGRKLANIFWVVLNWNPAMVGWNLPWRPSTCTSGMFESSIIISFKT